MKKILFLILVLLVHLFSFGHPVIIFKSSEYNSIGEAEFSISETKKIHFTKGNLLYQPSTKTWRIAPRQYDFVGGDNKTSTIPNGRQGTIWENGVQCSNTTSNHVRNYSGWIDVFAWGTSGWYGDDLGEDDSKSYTWRLAHNPINKVTCNPYNLPSNKDSVCMVLGRNDYQGFTDGFENADWGIRNNEMLGGTEDSIFRTPTKEEFDYLLNRRPNARNLSARGHIRLFGKGTSPDTIINGLIILPDDWDPSILPEKMLISDADGNEYYETNEYTAEEWLILEENGAIFLPATGNTSKFNRSGFYWTSTSHKNNSAWNVEFGGYGWNGHESDAQTKAADKTSGRAVRLVVEVRTPSTPELVVPTKTCDDYEKISIEGRGGIITSEQNPLNHCEWKLKAIPSIDYHFACWIDLHGVKSYVDSTDVTINTDIESIMMQAVFVKTASRIKEWMPDSITYITDSVDVLSGFNNGLVDVVTNNSKTNKTINKIDHGIWQQETPVSLSDNSNAGNSVHFVLFDQDNNATSVIDTICPVFVTGDELASDIDFNTKRNADIQVYGVLRIDRNVTINGVLDIHCGGKVVVQDDRVLEVNGIIMRGNGIKKMWPQLIVNGSIINHNNDTIYYDYTIDQKQYYPLSLPYTVKCSLVHNPMTGRESSYLSYYYDTDVRSMGNGAWTEFDDLEDGAEFEAGRGFVIYSVPMKWKGNRQRESVMRFPMKANLSFGEGEKHVNIRCSSENNGNVVDKNWNLIGNPYLADFTISNTEDTSKIVPGYYEWSGENGGFELIDDSPIRYVTYSTDGYRTYEQDFMRGFTMKPFNCYFVQTLEGNILNFLLYDRASSSPQRKMIGKIKDAEFGIVIKQGEDIDHTGILFGNYTDAYEINADLNKEFGNSNDGISLYSISRSGKMSFQAISASKMNVPIPVGYCGAETAPATISFDYSRYDASHIKELWLNDVLMNIHTNLMIENYVFVPKAKSEDNRFYISLVLENNEDVATDYYNTENNCIFNGNVYDILGNTVDMSRMSEGEIYIIVDENGGRKEICIK